jgi:hypothetical protein
MSNRIVRCFLDADLRCSHDGLAKIAKDSKVNVRDLESGEYAVFVNSARNKVKVYAHGEVLAYLRLPRGRSVDLRVIQHIPAAFNGKTINYDSALAKMLESKMA